MSDHMVIALLLGYLAGQITYLLWDMFCEKRKIGSWRFLREDEQ